MKRKTKNLIIWPLSTITTLMTDTHIYRHGDSMTDPVQRAESVKILLHWQDYFLEFSDTVIVFKVPNPSICTWKLSY